MYPAAKSPSLESVISDGESGSLPDISKTQVALNDYDNDTTPATDTKEEPSATPVPERKMHELFNMRPLIFAVRTLEHYRRLWRGSAKTNLRIPSS